MIRHLEGKDYSASVRKSKTGKYIDEKVVGQAIEEHGTTDALVLWVEVVKVHQLVDGLKAVFPVAGETHGATVEEAEMVEEEVPQFCVSGQR